MGIIELVNQHQLAEAREEGREEGMEIGMEIGIEMDKEMCVSKSEMNFTVKVAMRLIVRYPAFMDEDVADIVDMPVKFVKNIRRVMQRKQQQ